MDVRETVVLIVGAGPSGLSSAACLHQHSIPYIILEREDCIASLYNKRSYDRLHLHVAKHFCQLPFMPFPPSFPKYVPRADFVKYLDHYVSHFSIHPEFRTTVQFAKYDEHTSKWEVKAAVEDGGGVRRYVGRFLVVATGENTDAFTPEVDGLSEFKGEVIHSTEYKSGTGYENKKVLVVGAGNSGMEIALDLSNHGAKTSIVVRSPVHMVSRWSMNYLFGLLDLIPLHLVDSIIVLLSKVLPALKGIKQGGNEVVFEDGKCHQFDAIVFATGFKRSTHLWLQGAEGLLKNDGFPKQRYPHHWKGENGIYFVGLGKKALLGATTDAIKTANHIFNIVSK